MSAQGQGVILGKDPQTQTDIILRATKYGRSLEVMEGDTLRRVQVPQSVNASSCPPDLALHLLHDFPRSLGMHPKLKQEMFVNLGHYPNLRIGNMSFGLLTQSVAELLAFTKEDALQLMETGKATYFLGDHKGAGMWFVPKGRYSYPHVRWNQLKVCVFVCVYVYV
jgi:topoisomerase IA-like protein